MGLSRDFNPTSAPPHGAEMLERAGMPEELVVTNEMADIGASIILNEVVCDVIWFSAHDLAKKVYAAMELFRREGTHRESS